MTRKTKTEITIQTICRTTLWRRGEERVRRCPGCADDVSMLTLNEAAVAFRTSAGEIYRLAEAGAIHFTETGTGGLLICGRCLNKSRNL